MNAPYVPFVKTKAGEKKALKELSIATKSGIGVFFDVLALGKADTPAKIHTHLEKQVINIQSCWPEKKPHFVDLFDIKLSARGNGGAHPVEIVFNMLGRHSAAIPVVGFDRDPDYLMAIRAILDNRKAIGLRLLKEDLITPSNLATTIPNLLKQLGAENLPLHIIIDFRSINNEDTLKLREMAISALGVINKDIKPIQIIMAASAMVESMAGIKSNSIVKVVRRDYSLWKNLYELGFDITYGDYGVVKPDYTDLDPRLIKPAAKIRHTLESEWIIVKGTKWVDAPHQFHDLSKTLIANVAGFKPDNFGKEYINKCAIGGLPSYGNLQTWVTVDTNNHIEQTFKQVSLFVKTPRKVTAKP